MSVLGLDALGAVLLVPIAAATLLIVLPGYVLSARLHVVARLVTRGAAVLLFFERPAPGQ